MTSAQVARFPISIAEWQRNSREVVRISLDPFNDRDTIDIRSWGVTAMAPSSPVAVG